VIDLQRSIHQHLRNNGCKNFIISLLKLSAGQLACHKIPCTKAACHFFKNYYKSNKKKLRIKTESCTMITTSAG
jgi:hypothetical protein